jgi:hypothetical protein
LQQAESFPNRLEQTEIRRFHAMMLMDRAASGDREIAQMLLREAMESHTQIGTPRHVEIGPGAPQLSIQCTDPLASGLERIRTPP